MIPDKSIDIIGERLYVYWKDVNESVRNTYRKKIRAALEAAALTDTQDTDRLDWMDRELQRTGEVHDSSGNVVKLAMTWAIMGELDTLRETIDAARAHIP